MLHALKSRVKFKEKKLGNFHSTKKSCLNFHSVSSNEWNGIFQNFQKTGQPVTYTEIFENFLPEVFLPFNFSLSEFLEFSVEWFTFRKFNSFRNFWKLFPGNFCTTYSCFQISKGLVGMNGKRPQSVHCFFTLGVTWPCSNQWEQALLKKKIPVVIQKLFTIDQSFQKIRLESKDCFSCRWKISWSNGTSENVVMFLRTDCSSFRPSRPFFGKWNWFVQMVNAIPRQNLLVLCLPFAQTVNREVCPYKG